MKKLKSRREFLKLGAVATGVSVALLGTKKSYAKKQEVGENEILYRETEHFKKYYETLK
ncbi:MAG: hypothetical protein PWQ25_1887 [Deferribacteres bacterium]|jgi:hypothetical protein|nr:hypothetical protein [Deferribacteraceae bacterium]MDK2793024.1 hypothetical protein [Deferribacteres bacterium]